MSVYTVVARNLRHGTCEVLSIYQSTYACFCKLGALLRLTLQEPYYVQVSIRSSDLATTNQSTYGSWLESLSPQCGNFGK